MHILLKMEKYFLLGSLYAEKNKFNCKGRTAK